jgi:lipopolysaccharide export system protein LptA
MRIRNWVFAVIIMLLLPLPARATDEGVDGEREAADKLAPGAPDIEEFRLIHADSMTLTRQENEPQIFKGAVDIIMVGKDGLETRIKAGKLTIYYEQNLRKVRRIEVEENVEIHRLGTVATTQRAVYQGDKNIIELLVKPIVKDSRGELSADRITIFADSDKVVAEGNVKGIVYPEALEEAAPR